MPIVLRDFFPWLWAGLAICFSLWTPSVALGAAPWIFLSSAILLGVPHGACDPWIPGWVRQRPSRPLFLLVFFIIYLAISALYLGLWRLFPFPSTLFFLLLTAWHWGSADASMEFPPGLRWLLFSLSRGFLVILAPFAFHASEAWQVVQLMAVNAPDSPPSAYFLAGLGGALLLQILSRAGTKIWIETLILLGLFFIAPPLLSVGIYFMAFHAWRHLLRLTLLRKRRVPQGVTRWLTALAHLLFLSAPLTCATLLFLPWVSAWAHTQTQQGWVGPYLILLAVLTLPHAILVGWIDKEDPLVKL